jgi:hypothetical protein
MTIKNPGGLAYDSALTKARRQGVVGDTAAFRKLLVQECLRIERNTQFDDAVHDELVAMVAQYDSGRTWSDSPGWGRHDHPDLDETKDFGAFESVLDRAYQRHFDRIRKYDRLGDGGAADACLAECIGDILIEDGIVDTGWLRSFAAWCKEGHGISVSLRYLTNVVKTIDHAYGPGRRPTPGVDHVGPERSGTYRVPVN